MLVLVTVGFALNFWAWALLVLGTIAEACTVVGLAILI
jgi:hypothetical protein